MTCEGKGWARTLLTTFSFTPMFALFRSFAPMHASPSQVQLVMMAVCVLFDQPTDWRWVEEEEGGRGGGGEVLLSFYLR